MLIDVACPLTHPWAYNKGKKCCAQELKTDNTKIGYSDSDSDCQGGNVDCTNPSGGNCVNGKAKVFTTEGEKVIHVLNFRGDAIADVSFDLAKSPANDFNLDFVAADPVFEPNHKAFGGFLLPDGDTVLFAGGHNYISGTPDGMDIVRK